MSLQNSSCFAFVIDDGGVTFAGEAAFAAVAPNADTPMASATSAADRTCL